MQKILRKKRVLEKCEFSSSTLYRLMAKGAFPKSRSLTGDKAVGWLESDVNAWIEALPISTHDQQLECCGRKS